MNRLSNQEGADTPHAGREGSYNYALETSITVEDAGEASSDFMTYVRARTKQKTRVTTGVLWRPVDLNRPASLAGPGLVLPRWTIKQLSTDGHHA